MAVAEVPCVSRNDGDIRFGFRVFAGGQGTLHPHAVADTKRAPQGVDDEPDAGEVLTALRSRGGDRSFDELRASGPKTPASTAHSYSMRLQW